ncbi:MAG: hypothetical protein GYA23_01135 [Methanomicrobiales archaeon]|nr:hypothetical protein [Methanomicrobiales archaeon]
MKLQLFRFRLTTAILLVLLLVSVTIAPALAAGAINGDMSSARQGTTATRTISHTAFHHLQKISSVIMGVKWWHILVGIAIVALTVAAVVYLGPAGAEVAEETASIASSEFFELTGEGWFII